MHFTARITMRTNVAPEEMRGMHITEHDKEARWKWVTLATLHGPDKRDVEEAARIWLRNNRWFWSDHNTRETAEQLITIDISYKEMTGISEIMDRDTRI